MALNWIKWVKGLSKRPEVLAIAKALSKNRREVAAVCMEFWEWADESTVNGFISGVGIEDIDGILSVPGFASALCTVGWLDVRNDGIQLPRWDRHNGQSAKERALDSYRKSGKRREQDGSESCPENVRKMSGKKPDQSRVDKKNPPSEDSAPPPPEGGDGSKPIAIPENLQRADFISAWEEWIEYRRERKPRVTARSAAAMLAMLSEMGIHRAIEAIRHSVANGWQGIFEEKINGQSNGHGAGREQERIDRSLGAIASFVRNGVRNGHGASGGAETNDGSDGVAGESLVCSARRLPFDGRDVGRD